MIYITGDTHGDINRFKERGVRKLRSGDTLIICGDFGFVWEGGEKERRLLKWLGRRRYNILFVEGVHDNLGLLEKFPVEEWNGGRVRTIYGRLRMLCRGEVFEIEGRRVFAFGGGEPEESSLYNEKFEGELPTTEQIDHARTRLEKVGYKVDYIITHQPSRKILQFLSMDHNSSTLLDNFLDEVREKCEYRRWFFGSIHKNKRIPPSEMALFTSIVRAEDALQA